MPNQTSQMRNSVVEDRKTVLSSKQQQEFEKQQFEIHKFNTNVYNQMFNDILAVDDLNKPVS